MGFSAVVFICHQVVRQYVRFDKTINILAVSSDKCVQNKPKIEQIKFKTVLI